MGVTQNQSKAPSPSKFSVLESMELHYAILDKIDQMPLYEAQALGPRVDLYSYFLVEHILREAFDPKNPPARGVPHIAHDPTNADAGSYRSGYKAGWKIAHGPGSVQLTPEHLEQLRTDKGEEYVKGYEHGHDISSAAHHVVSTLKGNPAAGVNPDPTAANRIAAKHIMEPHATHLMRGMYGFNPNLAAAKNVDINTDAYQDNREKGERAQTALSKWGVEPPEGASHTQMLSDIESAVNDIDANIGHPDDVTHPHHAADFAERLRHGVDAHRMSTGVRTDIKTASRGGGHAGVGGVNTGDFSGTASQASDQPEPDEIDGEAPTGLAGKEEKALYLARKDEVDQALADRIMSSKGKDTGKIGFHPESGAMLAPGHRSLKALQQHGYNAVYQDPIPEFKRQDAFTRDKHDTAQAARIQSGTHDDDDRHPEGGLALFGPKAAEAAKQKGLQGRLIDPLGHPQALAKQKALAKSKVERTPALERIRALDKEQADRALNSPEGTISDDDIDIDHFNSLKHAIANDHKGENESDEDHLARILKSVEMGPQAHAAYDKKQADRITANKLLDHDKIDGEVVPIGPQASAAYDKQLAAKARIGPLPGRVQPAKAEPDKAEPAKVEPAKAEPAKSGIDDVKPKTKPTPLGPEAKKAQDERLKQKIKELEPVDDSHKAELDELVNRAEPFIRGLETAQSHSHEGAVWPEFVSLPPNPDGSARTPVPHPLAGQPITLNVQEMAKHLLRNPLGMHSRGPVAQAFRALGFDTLGPGAKSFHETITQRGKFYNTANKLKQFLHDKLKDDPVYMKHHGDKYLPPKPKKGKGPGAGPDAGPDEDLDILLNGLTEWLRSNSDMNEAQIEETVNTLESSLLQETATTPTGSIFHGLVERESTFSRPITGSIFDSLVEDDDDGDDDIHDDDEGGEKTLGDQPMVDTGSADGDYADKKPEQKAESSIFARFGATTIRGSMFDNLVRGSAFDGLVPE